MLSECNAWQARPMLLSPVYRTLHSIKEPSPGPGSLAACISQSAEGAHAACAVTCSRTLGGMLVQCLGKLLFSGLGAEPPTLMIRCLCEPVRAHLRHILHGRGVAVVEGALHIDPRAVQQGQQLR